MTPKRVRTASFSAVALALLACACACALGAKSPQSSSEAGGAAGPAGGWSPPAFCRGKDCPEFEILQTRDDVELRRYKKAHWISTNVTGAKWGDAYDEGYQRLQDYVKGGNADGRKLPQTNPSFTLVYVSDPRAHALSSTFTIEYFVPFELQDTPPAPTSTELAVTPVEQQDVWVLSFGGFATEDVVVTRGFEFLANLTGDGLDVYTEYFGVALYDQPARLLNRHNELWVWSKSPAPTTTTTTTGTKNGNARNCGGGSSRSKKAHQQQQQQQQQASGGGGAFASSFASSSSGGDGEDDMRVVMEQAWQAVGRDGRVRGGRSSYDSAAGGGGGGGGGRSQGQAQQDSADGGSGPGFEDVRRARESLQASIERIMRAQQQQQQQFA